MHHRQNRVLRTACAAFTLLLAAGSAFATVTIDHVLVGSRTVFAPGDTFQTEVRASWDGQGNLVGLFSSTGILAGDPAGLVAESAVFGTGLYRKSLFTFVDDANGDATFLGRLGANQLRQSVDPTSNVRSVQYGANQSNYFGPIPIDSRGAASAVLVTTITYRILFPGSFTIGTVIARSDTGTVGDVAGIGSTVTIAAIPEPGAATLLGLGLAGLGLKRARP